jgi:MFS superfamily sulfate permease-like transporter
LGVYAFVGSSPQLIVGPVSTVSVLTGSIVASHGAKSPEEALALVAALAVVSGLILIVAGLLRLGWVADFLSKPIVTGFVFGLSILVVLGEIPTLLGCHAALATSLTGSVASPGTWTKSNSEMRRSARWLSPCCSWDLASTRWCLGG